MEETDQILAEIATSIGTDVINSMQAKGRYATGQTARQIETVSSPGTAKLLAPDYIDHLEKGRSPTSSNPKPGDPPMIERIKAWCAAKGIPDKAAWAIKKNIDKYGYKGKPGVLSEPLSDENINLRVTQGMDKLTDTLLPKIAESLTL